MRSEQTREIPGSERVKEFTPLRKLYINMIADIGFSYRCIDKVIDFDMLRALVLALNNLTKKKY